MNNILKERVLKLNRKNFKNLTLEIFHFQASNNPIYRDYIKFLGFKASNISTIEEIPFLPIQFFKTQKILCQNLKVSRFFESSGTTENQKSKHYIVDEDFYKEVSKNIFEFFYGSLANYHIFALLPSYLEKSNSSLVYMVKYFLKKSASPSGFYLYNTEELLEQLQSVSQTDKKILLIGVTFALLELAKKQPINIPSQTIIMETGGMKGRGKEMVREELHAILKRQLNVNVIHCEYGMTELLSQYYSLGNGIFHSPSWCKILIREINDPFNIELSNRKGGINVIDLANVDSCSFIETQDIGTSYPDGKFTIDGRFDYSDLRGCNLMLE